MSIIHKQIKQDCIYLGKLDLCHLLLMDDDQYPWCILVPDRDDIEEIYQLPENEQLILIRESSLVAGGMMSIFKGDKMNLGALGNLVPQLHIHHIVRFRTDPAWPGPVWGKLPARAYDEPTLQNTIQELKKGFTDKVNWSDDI